MMIIATFRFMGGKETKYYNMETPTLLSTIEAVARYSLDCADYDGAVEASFYIGETTLQGEILKGKHIVTYHGPSFDKAEIYFY